MKLIEPLFPIIPDVYLRKLNNEDWKKLEELRFGSGRPLRLRYAGMEKELWPTSDSTMIKEILQRACRHSAYAYSDTIRQGYVTIEGGHRIGICGFGVLENGSVCTLRDPSSLNIRVARAVDGFANKLLPYLNMSTLLIGPPGSGKTTLLRDAIRLLSDRLGKTVGLADERGELSAMDRGECQLNVGSKTDILVNIPKSAAVMMLLRTMNPQWIALDEITAPEDIAAIEQACYCGVKLLATAHGQNINDLQRRPLYQRLMEMGVFDQIVILAQDKTYVVQEVVK